MAITPDEHQSIVDVIGLSSVGDLLRHELGQKTMGQVVVVLVGQVDQVVHPLEQCVLLSSHHIEGGDRALPVRGRGLNGRELRLKSRSLR